MIGALFAPADRRLLGIDTLRGPTPWLVAMMSFSILLIAAAGLATANSAALFERSVASRFTIELAGNDARAQPLLDALSQTAGVRRATPVGEAEMRADLRRWLGTLADARDLPVPALIDVDLAPGASSGPFLATVHRIGPDLHVISNRSTVSPVIRSLKALQWTALALVVLLALAAAAGVVLAARAALDTHRSTIDVLHGIGATDAQIAALFQRKIAIDSLAGSLGGAVAAGAALSILAAGSAFLGQLTGGATLRAVDLLLLAMLPLLLSLLATLVARAAVMTRLKATL